MIIYTYRFRVTVVFQASVEKNGPKKLRRSSNSCNPCAGNGACDLTATSLRCKRPTKPVRKPTVGVVARSKGKSFASPKKTSNLNKSQKPHPKKSILWLSLVNYSLASLQLVFFGEDTSSTNLQTSPNMIQSKVISSQSHQI